MMSEEQKIDKLIREKLKDFSEEPPVFVWDGVRNTLNDRRKRRFVAWYRWTSVAALILLAFIAGWYFNEPANVHVPLTTLEDRGNNASDRNMVPFDPPVQPEIQSPEKDNEQPGQDWVAETHTAEPAEKQPSIPDEPVSIQNALIAASFERASPSEYLSSRKAFIQTDKASQRNIEKQVTQIETGLSPAELKILDQNASIYAEDRKRDPGWKMGVNVSPGYASYSAKYGDSYESSMTRTATQGNASVSGGIALHYRTASRWSVESGVYYAQSGQQNGSSPQVFASRAESDFFNAPEQLYFNTPVSMDNNRIALNSTAGIIEIQNLPDGAEIAANLEKVAFSDNSLITQGELSQIFDLVEVPLILRYLVLESKMNVEIIGGMNAGFVVGNNAYIDNQYGLQKIGKTRDVSAINLSGTVGLGFNYALSKQFSLALEPRFSYYMNSLSSHPEVSFRPYRIGLYTGFYYSF